MCVCVCHIESACVFAVPGTGFIHPIHARLWMSPWHIKAKRKKAWAAQPAHPGQKEKVQNIKITLMRSHISEESCKWNGQSGRKLISLLLRLTVFIFGCKKKKNETENFDIRARSDSPHAKCKAGVTLRPRAYGATSHSVSLLENSCSAEMETSPIQEGRELCGQFVSRLPQAFLNRVRPARNSGAEPGFYARGVKGRRLLNPVAVSALDVVMDG